jgi:hypothetical protein
VVAAVADQQALRGAPATLSFQYLDTEGEPADPGTVTVGVNRADGTVLVAAGAGTSGTGTAPRTFPLTAVQTATLDQLTATWVRTADNTTFTTVIEVVGGYYFDIAAARASDPALVDDVKYPNATILAERPEVEAEFERICQVAFVPRYRRQRLDGTGASWLLLPTPEPRRVSAVSETDSAGTTTAWDASEVAAIRFGTTSKLTSPLRDFPCGVRNVTVAWEHGLDRPPAEVRAKAMVRLRYRCIEPFTAIPDRATSFQVEGGSVYRLDTPGAARTGIPEIDAVLHRYSRRRGVLVR